MKATLIGLMVGSTLVLALGCGGEEDGPADEIGASAAALSLCGPDCERLCKTKQVMCLWDRCNVGDLKCEQSCVSEYQKCMKGCQCPTPCQNDAQCPSPSVCHPGAGGQCAAACNLDAECLWCEAKYGSCTCLQGRCAAY